MGCSDESFASAGERVRLALSAMGGGNPAPYVRCWADSGDATLFGACGPVERGFPRLAETFEWVGSRFKAGALVPEDIVSFERGEVAVDDRGPAPMVIRVTHIYRRFAGEWRLIHRHADFPPRDQRHAREGLDRNPSPE